MNLVTLEQAVTSMEQRYAAPDRRHVEDRRFRFSSPLFPADYRQMTHWLAVARRRHYPPDLIARLEHLVVAGHQSFYARGQGGFRPIEFFMQGFPQIVQRNWRLVLFSALLFFGPLIAMPLLVQRDPWLAYMFVQGEVLDGMAENYQQFESLAEARTAQHDVVMWGFYFWNNITVDLRCFAWGAVFGIGAIFMLVYNGIVIGVVTGHVISVGAGFQFFTFTCTHGAPELIGAVISGAAGMRLGFALLVPAPLTRIQALHAASQEALPLLLGGIMLTAFAAFIEAFWSPNPAITPAIKFSAAGVLWLLIPLYLFLPGRGERVDET
jgi:uncharacterized membrane protein SpoIIM required for sporulation